VLERLPVTIGVPRLVLERLALAVPFHLAVTQLEYGEWLAAAGRGEEADPLFLQARDAFERLDAKPWLERTADGRIEERAVRSADS